MVRRSPSRRSRSTMFRRTSTAPAAAFAPTPPSMSRPTARPEYKLRGHVPHSMPVADLHVIGAGRSFAGLDQRLQAHQEDRPLRAAVVHELHRFPPTGVLEED